MQQTKGTEGGGNHEQLFMSLADGIGHTMQQLARLSEHAGSNPDIQSEYWRAVHDLTQSSMQLLEGYTLSMRLAQGTVEPELEPIAVTSLLYDAAHLLEPLAKQLQVHLELDMPGRLSPIMSDRTILQSAILSLGQVFIAAQSGMHKEGGTVRLGAHRGRYGIVAGWYGEGLDLTTGALSRARKLRGVAEQPMGELASGAATGVFIADTLLHSVASRLHVARYHNASGLAVTLPTCQQLQLV